eukprot:GILJ01001966.1.p1 GENE.GILJ01001966.1~~GILJ01001966.1.p1  ORF type:complete len:337 (+),score=42.86 GILJ01001966.1:133-1011(+)
MFYLRVVLCLGSLFYMLFNVFEVYGGIALDGVIFNAIFTSINLAMAALLAREKLPVKLNPEQEELYSSLFQSLLTRFQYKLLMKQARRRTVKKKNSTIMHEGNPFTHLSLVVSVSPGSKVVISKDKVVLNDVSKHAWIGMAEYVCYLNYTSRDDTRTYSDIGYTGVDNGISASLASNDTPVVYYTWAVQDLEVLFRHKAHGMTIRNGLNSLILHGVSGTIRHLDEKFVETYKLLEPATGPRMEEDPADQLIDITVLTKPLSSRSAASPSMVSINGEHQQHNSMLEPLSLNGL